MLDLSASELRKPARSASLVKLQSLLDLALNSDADAEAASGEEALFREDVRVTMSSSGLYEWLLKVVSVSGAIGEEGDGMDGHGYGAEETRKDKEKDEKKQQILGTSSLLPFLSTGCVMLRVLI